MKIMLKVHRKPFYTFALCALIHGLLGNQGERWVLSEYKELKEAADQKDPYAQGFLAMAFAHGDKGLDISIEDALGYAESSSAQDHWLGHFAMGYMARFVPYGPDSQKVKVHYLKAFQDPDGSLIREASRHDPVAAYALAEIFTSDEVRPTIIPDLKVAAGYYELSSEKGYGPASVQLALFKLHSIADPGLGINLDMKGGIQLLKKVANEGLPAAHHYLGRAYFKGLGIEEDKEMALVHFQAAADKGKSLSQLLVADFHAYGVAGPVKIDLAIRYARLAAIQQQDKALKKIQEYELLRKAPDQVENSIPSPPIETPSSRNVVPVPAPELPPPPPAPVAQRLPSVYQTKTLAESEVADPNLTTLVEVKAEDHSINSVTSTSPAADTRNLAKNAYWGKGQDVDLQGAFTLFTQSANAGDGESARYLGMMYMQGKGVTKDFKQALYWFDLAAQRGDAMAKSNLKKLQVILEK